MASSTLLPKLACLLVVCMIVSVPNAKADIDCQQVVKNLTPCASYLIISAPLSEDCCKGIKTVYEAGQTQTDRQNICKCLKSYANKVPSSAIGKAANLPAKCGLKIPFTISPSTDCNSLK